MTNFPIWAPFEDDEYLKSREFYDPYEGRKSRKSINSFYQDPFANDFPQNGWCRVPACYSEEPRRTRRRPFRQRNNETPRLQSKLKQTLCQVQVKKPAYKPLGTTVYTIIEENPENRKISTNPVKLESMEKSQRSIASVSSKMQRNNYQNDIDSIVKNRASKRIASWLHHTGLVDEFFVDMKSLPQNKYSTDGGSVNSKQSQEGVEVGLNGNVLEGNGERAEKKIMELKAITIREISKLDDKLQQEEKKQSSALQLSTLRKCPPVVQLAMDAQVNISNILTEVEYYQSIEENCERLSLELAMAEDECIRLSDIVDDHIAMQSFLVQLTLEWMKRPNFIDAEKFLQDKIVSVRELGHNLRSRLLQSIGKTFGDGDVEALKCLVDAMQLYENENDKLEKNDIMRVTKIKSIMITGIKKIATERILEDCEIRSHNVFQSYQEEAANGAAAATAEQLAFDAILNACYALNDIMLIVRRNLIPIFPSSWKIFPIWLACLGSVCTQYILQQIGGQEGNYLSLLLPKQLLKLVAWIEDFEHASDFGQNNDWTRSFDGKPEFVSTHELKTGSRINLPEESLRMVLVVLLDIHRLVEDQFLLATQEQTNQWLDSIYKVEHSKNQTQEGRLVTSLPEDLWILARVQLTTIRDQLSKESGVFFHAACIIFRCIQSKSRNCWRYQYMDVETCCAAANDALRMIHLAEVELEDIKFHSGINDEHFGKLEIVIDQLSTQVLQDAVLSTSTVYVYIFVPIEEALKGRLFEVEWEDLTYNDMAVTIVRTLEDYLDDMEKWFEESMLRKALDALLKATVNFYIKHLLKKSIRRQNHAFGEPERALQRMSGDICVLQAFFETWVDKFKPFQRVLRLEFEPLHAILKLLKIGHFRLKDNPTALFVLLHRHIRTAELTRFLCSQLWYLLSADAGKSIPDLLDASRSCLVLDEQPLCINLLPSLETKNVIQGCKDELKNRKVTTLAKNATKRIVTKAKSLEKRKLKKSFIDIL